MVEPLTRIADVWEEAKQIWRVGDRDVFFFKLFFFLRYLWDICFLPRSLLNICLIMMIRNGTGEALWPRSKEFYFQICQ